MVFRNTSYATVNNTCLIQDYGICSPFDTTYRKYSVNDNLSINPAVPTLACVCLWSLVYYINKYFNMI